MSSDPVSTEAVDYLQRLRLIPPLAARRVVRLTGVGQPVHVPTPLAVPESANRPDETGYDPATLSLLVGLAGANTPIALLLDGTAGWASVEFRK
ncbi:hypothetical protein [Streptomyces sp. NPDC003710]